MPYNTMPPMKRAFFEMHAQLPEYHYRVARAQAIVAKALLQTQTPYVGWSSGKDSLVTSHLLWSINPAVPGVYFDADCAFPESSEFLERTSQQHTLIKWQCEPLLETFARYGGPTALGIGRATMESTVYAPIRSLVEEYHFDGVFLGLRAEESEGRAKNKQVRGSIYRYKHDGLLACTPVVHLSYRDIWAYIVAHALEYNRIYDLMWELPEEDQRVSYWAGETKRTAGRWVWLRKNHPTLFNRFAERFPEVRAFV